MKRQPWGLYAIALATVVVGLVALGVPASALLVAALVLACPLMMIFMMAGMHSGTVARTRTSSGAARHPKTTTTNPPSVGGSRPTLRPRRS